MFGNISDSLLRKALAEEIEERMLEFDSTNIIPGNQLSAKFERKMRKAIKQYERPKVLRQIIIASKRVAGFVIILSALLFTTIFSVEALRTKFIEFVITTYEKYSNIFFSSGGILEITNFQSYIPAYIPYGFFIVHEDYEQVTILEYENEKGESISFTQFFIKGYGGQLNTEGIELEKIVINGNPGYYFSNQGIQNIIWHNDTYIFKISSSLDKECIKKIAKSTKFE